MPMKSPLIILIFILITNGNCVSEKMMAELREVQVYLAEALKPVFNKTTPVKVNELVHFVTKNNFMHEILKRFTSDKKRALFEMAGNFANGILSTVSDDLSKNEKEASLAYTNNAEYRSSWEKYEKDYPHPKCFSSDYGYVLLNVTGQIRQHDFDPMRFYYGTLQLIDSREGETKFKKEKLEIGLRNITAGLMDLMMNLEEFKNPEFQDCLKEAKKRVLKYAKIFETPDEFAKRVTRIRRNQKFNPMGNFTNIAKQIKLNYFESLSPHSYAFFLIASDFARLFDEMIK